MKKKIKKLIIYVFVFLLLAVILPVLVLKSDRAQKYVRQKVQVIADEKLGAKVDFSGFSLSYFPISLNLNDVEVAPADITEEASTMKIRQVKIQTRLRPWRVFTFLFSDKKDDIVVKKVSLIGPEADIYIKNKSIAGFPKLMTGASLEKTGVPGDSLKETEGLPEKIKDSEKKQKIEEKQADYNLVVNMVEVVDSYIKITDIDNNREMNIRGLEITANTKNFKKEIILFTKISLVRMKYNDSDEDIKDISFAGKFLTGEKKFKIDNARLYKGKESELKFSGAVDLGKEKTAYDFDVSLKMEDTVIKKLLPKSFKLVGIYGFSGKVTGKDGKFVTAGKLESRAGNIYGVKFKSLSCNVKADDEGLSVESLSAKTFGGDILGSYYLKYSNAPDFKAALKITNCGIGAIQKSCPAVPGLLDGDLTGELAVSGKFKDGYFIDVKADLTSPRFVLYKELYPKGEKEERLVFNDLKLKTSIEVSKDGLNYKEVDISTDDFNVIASGSMPRYKSYDIGFETVINNLEVMKTVFGIDKIFDGAVTAKGELKGKLTNPAFKMMLTATEVLYDKYYIDGGQGELSLEDGRFFFDDFAVIKDEFDLTLNGRVSTKDDDELALVIGVNKAKISRINNLLLEIGKDRVEVLDNMKGIVTGDVKLKSKFDDISAAFSLYVPNMDLYGKKGDVFLSGTANRDFVKIKKASLEKGEMSINVNGVVEYNKKFDLNYTILKVEADYILRILKKSDIDFNALMFSSGRVFGSIDDVKLSSDFSLSNIVYKGRKIKDSNLKLFYSKKQIDITGEFFNDELEMELKLSGNGFRYVKFKGAFYDFDLKSFLTSLGEEKDISAKINGNMETETILDYDDLKVVKNYFANTNNLIADLKLNDLTFNGYKSKESKITFTYKERFGDFNLAVLDDKIKLKTIFRYEDDIVMATTLTVSKLLISDIKNDFEDSKKLEGVIDIDLQFKMDNVLSIKKKRDILANLRDANGLIVIDKIHYNDIDFKQICVNLHTKEELLKITGICYDSLIDIGGTVDYKDKKRYSFVIMTKEIIDYPKLLRGFGIKFPKDIEGQTKLKVKVSGGIYDYKDYSITILSDLLTLDTQGLEFKNDEEIQIIYKNGNFRVESFKIKEKNSILSVSGNVDENKIADLKVNGDINLLLAKPFLPDNIERFEGMSNLTVNIKGNISDPEVFGELEVKKGTIGIAKFPQNVENVTGNMLFSKKELTFENIKGELSDTPIFAAGQVILSKFKPTRLNISLEYEGLGLDYPENVFSQSTAQLKLDGEMQDLTLSGSVDISKLRYTNPVEVIKLKDIFTRYKKRRSEPVRYQKKKIGLKFNVAVSGEEDMLIDNNVANCEIKVDLNLIGDVSNAVVIGDIEVVTGRVFYLDRDFEIESGMVNFSNESYISPFFDITARREIRPTGSDNLYIVMLHLVGEMDNAKLYIESNPPLDKTAIASLIVFEADPTGSEDEMGEKRKLKALELASGIAHKELQGKFGQYIGFDSFRVDPYYSESAKETSARLVIGKKVADKMFLTYSSDIAGIDDQSVELKYSLSNNFSLLGNWENEGETSGGSFGGDIKFRFEFR